MKARIVGVLGGLLVCGATAVHADPITPITITFDNPPCGTGAVGSDCYLFKGLSLESLVGSDLVEFTGFSIHSAADAVSPPNVASATRFGSNPSGLKGEFFVAPNKPTGWTNMVSFNITGSQVGSAPWTVQFLGSDGTLIETVSGTDNQRISFTQPVPNVHTFTVLGSSTQGIDNLTFNPVTTPEPASVVLLGSALAGIALGRWRRMQRMSISGRPALPTTTQRS